jgi:hypothetical protein
LISGYVVKATGKFPYATPLWVDATAEMVDATVRATARGLLVGSCWRVDATAEMVDATAGKVDATAEMADGRESGQRVDATGLVAGM